MNYLRLDLKICEGCGALWLRTGGLNGKYCRGCAGEMAEFPAPRGKHAGGRKRPAVGFAGGLEVLQTKLVRCNGMDARGGAR